MKGRDFLEALWDGTGFLKTAEPGRSHPSYLNWFQVFHGSRVDWTWRKFAVGPILGKRQPKVRGPRTVNHSSDLHAESVIPSLGDVLEFLDPVIRLSRNFSCL